MNISNSSLRKQGWNLGAFGVYAAVAKPSDDSGLFSLKSHN